MLVLLTKINRTIDWMHDFYKYYNIGDTKIIDMGRINMEDAIIIFINKLFADITGENITQFKFPMKLTVKESETWIQIVKTNDVNGHNKDETEYLIQFNQNKSDVIIDLKEKTKTIKENCKKELLAAKEVITVKNNKPDFWTGVVEKRIEFNKLYHPDIYQSQYAMYSYLYGF